MDINLSNINDFTDDEIYKEIEPSLKSFHKVASYVGISDMEYHNIVLNIIKQSKTVNNEDVSLKDSIIYNANLKLTKRITQALEDDEIAYQFFNKLIDEHAKDVYEYNSCIDTFKKLNRLFNKFNFIPDSGLLTKVINDNPIFNRILTTIIKRNKYAINSKELNSIFDYDALVLAATVYCNLNHIDLKESNYEELDNIHSSDSLYLYKKDICNYPLLTPDQELELARKMKSGDKEAEELFINSNLRLPLSIALRYRFITKLQLEDLVQIGNMGLLKVVKKYDPEKGFKFGTYATHYIRRYILNGIREFDRTIRLPVNKSEEVSRFRTSFYSLSSQLGRDPSIEEIAKYKNIDYKKAFELFSLMEDTMSLNEIVGTGEDAVELGYFIPDHKINVDKTVYENELPEQIKKLFEECKLTEKQKYIILKRFGVFNNEIITLEKVGKDIGVSRERVRQLEAGILKIFRTYPNIGKYAGLMDDASKAMDNISEYKKRYALEGHKGRYKKHLKEHKKSSRRSKIDLSKSIYEVLAGYSEDDIDDAILDLSSEDRDIIYGLNLDKIGKYNYIIRRMKKYLESKNEVKGKKASKKKEEAKAKAVKKKEDTKAVVVKKEEIENASPFLKELKQIEEKQKNMTKIRKRVEIPEEDKAKILSLGKPDKK